MALGVSPGIVIGEDLSPHAVCALGRCTGCLKGKPLVRISETARDAIGPVSHKSILERYFPPFTKEVPLPTQTLGRGVETPRTHSANSEDNLFEYITWSSGCAG